MWVKVKTMTINQHEINESVLAGTLSYVHLDYTMSFH